jgi:hypothetical protein
MKPTEPKTDALKSLRGSKSELRVETISGPRSGARAVWVEIPSSDGAAAAWCYSDKRSYVTGQKLRLFVSSNVTRIVVRLYRDGLNRAVVYETGPLDVDFQPMPERAFEVGCQWSETHEWSIPNDLPSGGYIVEILDADATEASALGHHFVAIRPSNYQKAASIALIAATSTWAAYNDWGGASHYYGIDKGLFWGRAARLSTQRPWGRGQVWLPLDAPRMMNAVRPEGPVAARYDCIEWAALKGFSKYYASAGWATYERPFVRWLEGHGFSVDVYTQDDLHFSPEFLERYDCAAIVGHDEYWTREMRGAIECYTEAGGNVARFGGNFMWQIRIEDEGRTQTCYKYEARKKDPVVGTDDADRMTGAWEDPLLNYPGAKTFGVNAFRGQYSGFGGSAPRNSRGFTVFKPEHWAFEGTGLGYADQFGDKAGIFGIEVDGLDYNFVDGLPVPTGIDGAPPQVEILAFGFATLSEHSLPEHAHALMLGDGDARFRSVILEGSTKPDVLARNSRGCGLVIWMNKGKGEVFTAGTCEWVAGLLHEDHATQAITRNVLQRFTSKKL